MPARFHLDALRLAGVQPTTSIRSELDVAALESRLARPLPASVREWYTFDEAIPLLRRFSNTDCPIAVADLVPEGSLLPFMTENQGVCRWAIELDDSDDPPVRIEVDPATDDWTPCADSFSRFIFSRVWDFSPAPLEIQSCSGPLTEADLQLLRVKLPELPPTYGWPGDVNRRFGAAEAASILINDKRDLQADWYLRARTPDQLCALLAIACAIPKVRDHLFAHELDAKGILQAFLPQPDSNPPQGPTSPRRRT